MKKIYQWRELTDDGLMKLPKPIGPYYDEITLNGLWGSGGYDTKEEAEADLVKYIGNSTGHFDFVLVELYVGLGDD